MTIHNEVQCMEISAFTVVYIANKIVYIVILNG